MKLHRCRYCKTEVSPRARSCPSCGEPNPARGGRVEGIHLLIRLFFILLVFGLLIMYIFDGIVVQLKPSIYLFSLLAGAYMFRFLAREP